MINQKPNTMKPRIKNACINKDGQQGSIRTQHNNWMKSVFAFSSFYRRVKRFRSAI